MPVSFDTLKRKMASKVPMEKRDPEELDKNVEFLKITNTKFCVQSHE
jgi:hypothetical protein